MSNHKDDMHAPGVFVFALVFLAVFIVIWFAHLKWIMDIWAVR